MLFAVAPLNIRLLGKHQALSAGHRYDLLCQSSGSRPPALITWWRDGQRLEKATETVSFVANYNILSWSIFGCNGIFFSFRLQTSADGNETTSSLSITLNRTDGGKYLTCQAYNKAFSTTEPLEDGWKLDILCEFALLSI